MKKKVSEKTVKTIYAIVSISCFFLAWSFVTNFTPARLTTPGPLQVLKLLVTSITTPIGKYTLYRSH